MTAGIRHFTASAIVFDDSDRVLLVHHNKIGLWLYPGGHIDPNEDPAEAALREVWEETGIRTEVIADRQFAHPAVATVPPPFAILEMDVQDSKVGRHRHIDLVYVCRPISGDLIPQKAEVRGARWAPAAELVDLHTPAELPDLIAEAIRWAKPLR
jgi:8-oxo-dGTP pyrophosphatase MutT (NUDIX family)